jgi:ABC-type glycerol-3-phosphate transport system substrate-binding protein
MLKLSVTLLGGSVLAACGQATQAPAPTSTTAPAAPEATATSAPKPSEPTATTAPKAAEPTATTAAPPKKVEGTVVIMHQRNELSEDQQKQFESDNPGIKMDFIENDLTRFFAMYAAGAPPDLYRTQAPILPSMLARKLLYDLTPYFETSTVLKLDDLAPANNYYRLESPLKVGSGPIYGMCKDFSPDFTVRLV